MACRCCSIIEHIRMMPCQHSLATAPRWHAIPLNSEPPEPLNKDSVKILDEGNLTARVLLVEHHALGRCLSPTATAAEARSATAALRAILAKPRAPARLVEPAVQEVPEPEPVQTPSDEEFAPEPNIDALMPPVLVPVTPVCQTGSLQPNRRRRRQRGRRGRRGQHRSSSGPVAAETVQCFSPVREHEEKEKRERPPRRYDKAQGGLCGDGE
eukprot:COSAG02_NODE_1210_length_13856_cov_12.266182_15_plen_212_part_00